MNKDKLLLVDDEQDFLRILAKYFQQKGLAIKTADRCSRALEIMAVEPIDVVILDMMMPGLSGMECMGMMKTAQPDIQVILLSGCGDLNRGIAGMKQGAFDYLLKPAPPALLYEKVMLARKQLKSVD